MVDSIEILSDIAVVDQNVNPTSATVAYQVKNQYGEDITKTTSLTTNGSKVVVNPATGVVTVDVTGQKVGDKVAVALVDAETAKSATKVVTLSSEAAVSDVTVTSLYNKDGKKLNEDTNLTTDAFYLLVDVKDQYGNAITNKTTAAEGLIKSETNPTVIQTDGSGNDVTFTDVTIDGKKRLGLKLTGTPKAGESQITLISTTTGKNVSYKINVAETTRTDIVSLSAPALAVANEDILVPVSVLDKEGNAVTDLKVLNATAGTSYKGVKVSYGNASLTDAFVKGEDNNLYIKVPKATNTANGTFPLVAQSSTFKVATSTIKVEKAAVATAVRGLKNPLAIAAGKTETLTAADLIIEDQYGREMSATAVASYLAGGKGILVQKENVDSTVVTLTGVGVTNQTIKTGAGVDVKAGSLNGSETLKFVLADANGTNTVAASTADGIVRVTDGTEYDSYEIAPIGKVQASDVDSAGNKKFTVNGLLNGGKVSLDQGTDFTATITGGVEGNGAATVVGNEIIVDKSNLKTDGADVNPQPVDTEFTLKVTINATGKVVEQKFIVSADAKEVTDFFFTTSGTATDHTGVKAITEATLANGATVASANLKVGAAVVNIATTDQYGNKAVVALAPETVTIVPAKASEVTITDNGTQGAKATLKSPATEANLTIKVKVEDVTKDLKVTLKAL